TQHERSLQETSDSHQLNFTRDYLENSASRSKQQAVEVALLHEIRKGIEAAGKRFGCREGNVDQPVQQGYLRQTPATKRAEPVKQEINAGEFHARHYQQSDRLHHERKRVLHLAADRISDIASVEPEEFHRALSSLNHKPPRPASECHFAERDERERPEGLQQEARQELFWSVLA